MAERWRLAVAAELARVGQGNDGVKVTSSFSVANGLQLPLAGIAHEYRAGGVVRGGEYPRSQEIPVVDSGTMKAIGFTIRASSAREADRRLTTVAESLGLARKAVTIAPRTGWDTDWL
jgi:hypothetical protein